MSEEEAYKIFSEMTPDVLDYVFCLAKAYTEKDEEIERLKQGYCELKEKCNKGECDCTNEEYNGMCEANIELNLEIERLHSIIKEVRELLQKANIYRNYDDDEDDTWYTDLNIDEALEILDKGNKNEIKI